MNKVKEMENKAQLELIDLDSDEDNIRGYQIINSPQSYFG